MLGTLAKQPLYQRTLVILCIVPMMTVVLIHALQLNDLRMADRAAAARSAVLLARTLESIEPAQLDDWLAREVAGDDVTRPILAITIEDAAGAVLAGAGRRDISDAVAATANSAGGQRVRVQTRPTPKAPLLLRGAGLALLFTLASLLAYIIATLPPMQRLIASIDNMTRAVDSYRQSNFTPRLPERALGQLGELAAKLNQMADTLSRAQTHAAHSARSTQVDLQSTLEEVEIKNVELDIARKRAVREAHDKARFLANMSHEIRTPMNAIVGYSQLLEASPLDAAQRDYLKHIERSSQTLLNIIDDILNLSRLEAGRVGLEERDFDIREIVALVVDMLAPQAYGKGLSVRTRIEPEVPARLHGDAGKIRQVVSNFLSNAVKFTDRGLVEVRVSAKATGPDTTQLKLRVRDTGRGIDEADRQMLFEPFTQSSRRSEGGGAGLGLTIARAMTHAMSGELTLHSEPGVGSTFVVELPLGVAEADGFAFLHALRTVDTAVYVRDPTLREHLVAHLNAIGARVLCIDGAPAGDAQAQARFAIVEQAQLEDPEGPAFTPGQSVTPLILIPTADRKKLQAAALEHHGLALPAHADATRILSTLARQLGADTPNLTQTTQAVVLPDIKGSRVLVADDDALSRSYLEDLLGGYGAHVTACPNGNKAVAMGKTMRFDAIILDLRMPECGGEEAARRLRARGPNQATPMIALTASALSDDQALCERAGFDECLLKPAPVDRLLNSVHRGMSAARRELQNAAQATLDHAPFTAHEVTRELRRYRDAIVGANNTPEETAELAHRLRGAAAVSRLPSVEECAADLEAAARARHADAMVLALTALANTLDDTLGTLELGETRH